MVEMMRDCSARRFVNRSVNRLEKRFLKHFLNPFFIQPVAVLVLLLTLTLSASAAHAMRAVFFQPQLKDMEIPEQRWPQIFASARALGMDTLVIQWSEYGTAFTGTREDAWLTQRVQEAAGAQLKIVMGLYADPDMFAQLDSSNDLLEGYLLPYLEKNRRLAQRWSALLLPDQLVGWYLPLEIDDRRWRDPKALEILTHYLAREVRQLSVVKDQPVYVSTFFRANISPVRYREMLTDLQRATGIRSWVQDGRGTAPLSSNEINLYLRTLTDCKQPAVAGVVYEVFKQIGPDQAFKAEALPPAQRKLALKQTAPCGLETVYFSLRYLVNFLPAN